MLTLEQAQQQFPKRFIIHEVFGVSGVSKTKIGLLPKTNRNNLCCVRCGIQGEFVLRYQIKNEVKTGNGGIHHDLFAPLRGGGIRLFTVDHILPKSKGGRDSPSNYRVMCSNCNGRRSNVLRKKEWQMIFENPEQYVSIAPKRFENFKTAITKEWDTVTSTSIIDIMRMHMLRWPTLPTCNNIQ